MVLVWIPVTLGSDIDDITYAEVDSIRVYCS